MPTTRPMPSPIEAVPTRRPLLLADRFRIERPLDDDRFEATDTRKGNAVIVTRARFGKDQRAERDQLLDRVRALWTVTAPGLVLPIDSGEWDDDAFVAEERVEAPSTTLREGLSKLDAYERASAARNVAEAVASLHAAGFVHGHLSLDTIELDGYRQPKIHTATIAMRASTESERAEDRTLRALLDEIAPGAVTAARPDMTAAELVRSIAQVEPGPTKPFVPVTPTGGPWQGLTLLAIFLTMAAFVAIGWLFRQL
jgi:hypothetical protein